MRGPAGAGSGSGCCWSTTGTICMCSTERQAGFEQLTLRIIHGGEIQLNSPTVASTCPQYGHFGGTGCGTGDSFFGICVGLVIVGSWRRGGGICASLSNG